MKRLTLLALMSSPVFAHQISPQTEFFKEELKRDPMIVQVLNWCNLVGITDETVCKAEMYDAGGNISSSKVSAAKICMEKSGIERKAALDKFFKVDPNEQSLVGHQVMNAYWHLDYVVDPAEGPNAKPHKHFYTELDIKSAGMERGQFYVNDLKNKTTADTTTAGTATSGTATLGASGVVVSGEGSVTHGKEDSETKGKVTQQQLDEAYAKGKAEGEANPQITEISPLLRGYFNQMSYLYCVSRKHKPSAP